MNLGLLRYFSINLLLIPPMKERVKSVTLPLPGRTCMDKINTARNISVYIYFTLCQICRYEVTNLLTTA